MDIALNPMEFEAMFYYAVNIHDEVPVMNVAFGSMLRSDGSTHNLTFSFVFFLFSLFTSFYFRYLAYINKQTAI